MKHIIRRHTISFKNAYTGVKWAFSSQPNYTVHVFLSLLAITGGLLFNISYNEWLTILTFIILGLTIETINTAIESATDCIDTHIREDIKIAKDAAAAAMLIFAIGSVVVAIIIFVPKLLLIIS